MKRGRIFAVVGPSGAGKDTLMAGALAARADLSVVRRVITRPPEAGGEDFEGVTPAAFARRKAAGEFALSWTAHGLSYGLPWAAFRPVTAGRDTLFNGSRAILTQAREVLPGLHVILVTAPPEVLAARLAARGREDAADIAARLTRANYDLPPGLPVTAVDNATTRETGIAAFLAALQAERV
jgi:phosphonate metabolism protein PhnN/1,5-bisphosphokinase (PRPP-forming)